MKLRTADGDVDPDGLGGVGGERRAAVAAVGGEVGELVAVGAGV